MPILALAKTTMRLPDDSKRLSIIGTTGSGKTIAALWHLSNRSLTTKPWLVYNFKDDASIDGIPYARNIDIDEVPVKPGVFVVHPHPHQTDEVEAQLWAVWEKGGTGVYIDEGYMVGPNNRAFRALLTQGRSRENPMIVLSQRPVWMDRFVFSESEFFQVFRMNHRKDVKSVEEFVPADLSQRLPEFHSYYYDVGENKVTVLKPVPPIEKIYQTFERRLHRQKRTI